MPELRVIGRLDHNFGWWDGHLADDLGCDPATPVPPTVLGAVTAVGTGPADRYRLLRDPLGLNKLFWSQRDDAILVAARPRLLVKAGCPFETIRAIPRGAVVDLDLQRGGVRVTQLRLGDVPVFSGLGVGNAVTDLAAQIRARLDAFLEALARGYQSAQVFVCLSGGLDSAGIAALVRDHFPGAAAVSFDILRSNGHVSEDRRTAQRLARDLGLPLLCVTATEDDVLGALDTVLVEAIDWRDFNVHAALVNACLARGIAGARVDGRQGMLALTGDLPNEFLIDYNPETYRERLYYRLPRLKPEALRAILVRGLDTSHREVGPFEAWGLSVVQPYATAADLYVALPPEFLGADDRKQRLSRHVFGPRIPDYVYARGKTRAQVGDGESGWGVLALCADRGLDAAWLRRRYAELHGVHDVSALDRFIRGGRYRSGIPLLDEESA